MAAERPKSAECIEKVILNLKNRFKYVRKIV